MTILNKHLFTNTIIAFFLSLYLMPGNAFARPGEQDRIEAMGANKARVVEHWSKDRRVNAIPRDLLIDPRGLGYLRRPNGFLQPYGHLIAAEATLQNSKPFAKPAAPGGNNRDSTPPLIANLDPAAGAQIGAEYTFSATVFDASGIKSVSFVIQYPSGSTQSFSASASANDIWTVSLRGFTDGNWNWWVVATDNAGKGGNTATSAAVAFSVVTTGGGGGAGGDTVTNAPWTAAGVVQTAAGRIYFEMPGNSKRKGQWTGYVCSGTVVTDEATGRSLILTAAHCVYDDLNQSFARNVLFIPDQAGTTASGTDLNCNNDPLGCWVPDHGVVDFNWTAAVFPDNIPWDYAFYVVDDSGAHAGLNALLQILDGSAGSLPISFSEPAIDDGVAGIESADFSYALGYSYSDDPNFMYCAEDMTTEGSDNWWLPSCELKGGSSGGPWVQPMDVSVGSGSVISVNSWGYTNSPGMAGPKFFETSTACLFGAAKLSDWSPDSTADGDAGIVQICP